MANYQASDRYEALAALTATANAINVHEFYAPPLEPQIPEQRLVLSILEQAIADLHSGKPALISDAWAWIEAAEGYASPPLSFANVCFWLNLVPSAVRKALVGGKDRPPNAPKAGRFGYKPHSFRGKQHCATCRKIATEAATARLFSTAIYCRCCRSRSKNREVCAAVYQLAVKRAGNKRPSDGQLLAALEWRLEKKQRAAP